MEVGCMVLRYLSVPGPYWGYMKDETCLEMLWRDSCTTGACWIGRVHWRMWGWVT